MMECQPVPSFFSRCRNPCTVYVPQWRFWRRSVCSLSIVTGRPLLADDEIIEHEGNGLCPCPTAGCRNQPQAKAPGAVWTDPPLWKKCRSKKRKRKKKLGRRNQIIWFQLFHFMEVVLDIKSKWLFSDLDGTLLNDALKIQRVYRKRPLLEYQQQGCIVDLSQRNVSSPWRSIGYAQKQLKIKEMQWLDGYVPMVYGVTRMADGSCHTLWFIKSSGSQ